jgi:DNA-binding MarR family transcriptional regulator
LCRTTFPAASKSWSKKHLIERVFTESDLRAQQITLTRQGKALVPRLASLGDIYVVWIAGRHVTYFGRQGETLIERVPGSM